MARKKRLKLPNGYGSIKYLGKNRRNPYAVYPPAQYDQNTGKLIPGKALGYTETWESAYELLTVYNMEKKGKIKTTGGVFIDRSPLFKEVYEDFYKEKYETDQSKKYSYATKYGTRAAYLNCSAIHDIPVSNIKYDDLQNIFNTCPLKHASMELMLTFLHQIYKYMLKHELVEKDHSLFIYIPKEKDDEHGEPFSEDELRILWNNKTDPIVKMLLIMCYSGYRILAYTKMDINKSEWYFKGGVKTTAGKERIVPIHSGIREFISLDGIKQDLLGCHTTEFRLRMYEKLTELNIANSKSGTKHTPHDCRHTFSALCERYKVNENDRKRMMGHSFGSDITNGTYGHRTVEELREEIEKIKIPE